MRNPFATLAHGKLMGAVCLLSVAGLSAAVPVSGAIARVAPAAPGPARTAETLVMVPPGAVAQAGNDVAPTHNQPPSADSGSSPSGTSPGGKSGPLVTPPTDSRTPKATPDSSAGSPSDGAQGVTPDAPADRSTTNGPTTNGSTDGQGTKDRGRGQAQSGISSQRARSAANSSDRLFVRLLAIGNLAEVELAKNVPDRTTDEGVRSFARHMVDAHSAAGEELRDLGQKQGFTVPNRIDDEHREVRRHLEQLRGHGFDRTFLLNQIREHHKTVTLLQWELSTGKNAELRAFAQKLLPVVRSHLAMARQEARRLARGEAVSHPDTLMK